MQNLLAVLSGIIDRHAVGNGITDSAIPGLSLIRADAPTMPMPVVYQPTLCLVAQGRKQVALNTRTYVYDAEKYLIASVELPLMGSVIEASAEQPYLCLCVDLDLAQLSDLALRHPMPGDDNELSPEGIALTETTPALLGATVRLAALLDTPGDIEALAPLVMREILYRLLTGPGNRTVRHMAQSNSRLSQIARAIRWIREHYTEACKIDEVAEIACMSRSTFHVHFKAITSMSPLEFRTQLRLHEARRLMLADAVDASSAGFRVGYDSPSQFSRDYAHMFGAPPARDVARLRVA